MGSLAAQGSIESLSCGVPVVAANVGSVPETVILDKTGLLFESGDLEGFVSATIFLLKDKSLRKHLGAEGCRRVRRGGHWRVWSKVTRNSSTAYI